MHTIGLYRYNANPDFLAGTAELEGLATFTGAQIAGSKYWLMKVATGVAEGSWLIVDWDAIQQETPADIINLYGFDGWALTPKSLRAVFGRNSPVWILPKQSPQCKHKSQI